MDYIRGADRRQAILFPEVINDYIEKDNPVQFIDVFVESLDVKGLGFTKAETKPTGRPPYDPREQIQEEEALKLATCPEIANAFSYLYASIIILRRE